MRVLVAGGTKFIGRTLVEMLLADGHEVTLFNRGKSGPGIFPDVREIHGDRAEPPAELGLHEWDWVFDMSGYRPAEVEKLAGLVGPNIGRYVFCSTASVYDWDGSDAPLAEESKLIPYTPENIGPDAHPARSYGASKTGCEQATFQAAQQTGMEASIVRPVLVYGPYDPTDRLHWWLHRVKEGLVVIPEEEAGMVHQVFVKDLARIFIAAAKSKAAAGKIYNGAATRPASLMDWIGTASQVVGKKPEIVRVPKAKLEEHGVKMLPGLFGDKSLRVSTDRLETDFGFTSTPFAETLRDAYEFMAQETREFKEAVPLEVLKQLAGN